MVMLKINDQLRAETVAAYLRGTVTQKECCAIFEVQTGHRLSVRTLRSWVARFGASGRVDARTQDLLADALDQVRALAACLQAVLDRLDGEAAAPMPARHVESSDDPLPPAASSAGPATASAASVESRWAAAATLPPGTQVVADDDERTSIKSFWD